MAKKAHPIGILGGTFHPIHNGHVMMAHIALEEMKLKQVWFLPDGMPPHKSIGGVTPQQRLEMVRLAVEDVDGFVVAAQEVQREGYTYTVDTMRELTARYPDESFVQIIGADTLLQLESWREFDEIAKLCAFFVVPRKGTKKSGAKECAKKLKKKYDAKIYFAEQSSIDISSTTLRQMLETGEGWQAFIPEKTAAYIEENQLYRASEQTQFDSISDRVRKSLPLSRWHHTLGVVQTAVQLAQRFGVDVERARLAALIHDCAKTYHGKEAEALMANYKVELDAFSQNAPKLWHGPLGAAIAKHEYGVEDEEILNAVRIHTVGAANMTTLEKVIKLADLIEPGRTYDAVEEIREIAKNDLDGALLAAMKNTMGYLKNGSQNMHPDSIAAIKALEDKQ